MTTAITAPRATDNITATTPGVSTTTPASSEDRFLKLLVAQLSNQDPMNPMDNAQMTSQMAQISTVSGVQQVNQTLQSLATQLGSMQMLQGSSLVGHDVLVESSRLAPVNGKANGAVDLALPADSVKIDILSAGGQVIDTVDLGAQGAGRHTFDWNATGQPASSAVSYRVTATKDGASVSATTLARDKVLSVSSDNGAMSLQLEGLGNVAYSSVKSIL